MRQHRDRRDAGWWAGLCAAGDTGDQGTERGCGGGGRWADAVVAKCMKGSLPHGADNVGRERTGIKAEFSLITSPEPTKDQQEKSGARHLPFLLRVVLEKREPGWTVQSGSQPVPPPLSSQQAPCRRAALGHLGGGSGDTTRHDHPQGPHLMGPCCMHTECCCGRVACAPQLSACCRLLRGGALSHGLLCSLYHTAPPCFMGVS